MSDSFLRGAAWRLAPPERVGGGPAGQRLGRQAGASLEFHEFRDYQAGDDLRHVDWRAYARSGQLHVRLHREEVAATAELILDGSRSMALTPRKAAGLRNLAAFFAGAAAGEHALRAVLAADPPQPLPADSLRLLDAAALPLDAEHGLPDLPVAPMLRAGSLRIVLSDFLFPHPPAAVARIALGAARTLAVQLLDPEEEDPPFRGALRLRAVEGAATEERNVDQRAYERYRARLARLREDLGAEFRRRDGMLTCAVAGRDTEGEGLTAWARRELAPTGWVEER